MTIKAGAHGSGSTSRNIPITDMDTLNCDYSYYKIQLPYYNEVFGNPNGATHAEKYGGNYTEYVVTGWEIEAAGSTTATDYNFADRNSINGRVFAQGGYYYVPKDVTSITIIWSPPCLKVFSIDSSKRCASLADTFRRSTTSSTLWFL